MRRKKPHTPKPKNNCPHIGMFKFEKTAEGVKRTCKCGYSVTDRAIGRFSHPIGQDNYPGRKVKRAA